MDNYPTGRKHCSKCKRWRHGLDFNVRKWVDEPECTIPLTLTSICKVCDARKQREKNGYKTRNWYPNGTPDSEKEKKHRREMNKNSEQRRRRKKAYRETVNEYRRIWRNAKIAEEKAKELIK